MLLMLVALAGTSVVAEGRLRDAMNTLAKVSYGSNLGNSLLVKNQLNMSEKQEGQHRFERDP